MPRSAYIGRYAPSPTGALHLGNLRTAMLAWLHAKLNGGEIVLRMEDLDTPRVVEGSADQILRDLEKLGITWQGEVVYQSTRLPLYESAMQSLDQLGLLYPCFCSRKELQQIASAPHQANLVYPGTCAQLDESTIAEKRAHKVPSVRLRVTEELINYGEKVYPNKPENLAVTVGDFVLKRADGLFAYQLAVVVDDIDQGITDVVRGADLLQSTARQHYLATLLDSDKPPMRYWHVPLLMDRAGARMSKRDGSYSLDDWLEAGNTIPDLVAQFASELGLLDTNQPISLDELQQQLSLDRFESALRNSI